MNGRRRNLLDPILVDSSSCLCIVDARCRIRFFSPGMEAWTGWPADQIEGLSCDALDGDAGSPADLVAAVFRPAAAVWQGQTTFWTAVIPGQDGRRLQAEFCSFPLSGPGGQVERVVSVRLSAGPDQAPLDRSIAQRLHAEIAALRADFRRRHGPDQFLSADVSMEPVRQLMDLLKNSRCSFTVVGESGTGRQHLAECVHAGGTDAESACVSVDCELLSAEELYDVIRELRHLSAEHAGAHEHPGMLLLLHVDRLPREVQQWLLEHTDECRSIRLAATGSEVPDVTVRDGWMLPEFSRLIAPLHVLLPRLHDRGEDVLLLAHAFIQRNRRLRDTSAQELSAETARLLLDYQWPGNVRELQQVIFEACDACSTSVVQPDDLPFAFRSGMQAQTLPAAPTAPVRSLDDLLRDVERRILSATLSACGNNKAETARRLGLTRPSLYRRLKSLGLDAP